MSDLQILRTMHPPDVFIEQIALLYEQVGRSVSIEALGEKIDVLPKGDRLLLAVEGEFLVGYAHLAVHNALYRPDSVEVVDLIVHPDHRRQGIGRRLFNAAETWAQATDRHSLIIRMHIPDSAAYGFLTSLQFDQQSATLEFIRLLS
ncbi:MAG: GNAT family N-acetyltransferase [Anaerolineales bacterium]|jgi:GNAT superfamily N-acetyltransferase